MTDVAGRLRLALEMFEVGERMQRARLRRAHPDSSDGEIESLVREWLACRPGAENGDCPGTVSSRFG